MKIVRLLLDSETTLGSPRGFVRPLRVVLSSRFDRRSPSPCPQGDTLVVTKIDRLARSTVHLCELVKSLEAKGAALRVLSLGGETVDTRSATGKLILTVFAGFPQFKREIMLERQREGIAKAKAEGRCLGRKPTARAKAAEAVAQFKQGRNVSEIARALSIGRGSVYRALESADVKPSPKAQASG